MILGRSGRGLVGGEGGKRLDRWAIVAKREGSFVRVERGEDGERGKYTIVDPERHRPIPTSH